MAHSENGIVQCWCWKCLGMHVDSGTWYEHNGHVQGGLAKQPDQMIHMGYVWQKVRPAPKPKWGRVGKRVKFIGCDG